MEQEESSDHVHGQPSSSNVLSRRIPTSSPTPNPPDESHVTQPQGGLIPSPLKLTAIVAEGSHKSQTFNQDLNQVIRSDDQQQLQEKLNLQTTNQTLKKPSQTTQTQQSDQYTKREKEVLSPKFRDNKLAHGGAANSNLMTKESYFGVTGDKIEPKQSPAQIAAATKMQQQQMHQNKYRNKTKISHIQVAKTVDSQEGMLDPKLADTLLKKEQSVEYRDILQGKRSVPRDDSTSNDANMFQREYFDHQVKSTSMVTLTRDEDFDFHGASNPAAAATGNFGGSYEVDPKAANDSN